MPKPPACRHCGSPVGDGPQAAAGFCCPGCAVVHRLITEQGHDAFYRIKDPLISPVDAGVFQSRDHGWLKQSQEQAEAKLGNGTAEMTLDIQGISCAGCVWLIERVSLEQAGLQEIRVDAGAGSLCLRWLPGQFDADGWARKIEAFGYAVGPAGEKSEKLESTQLSQRLGLCAAFALNVMLFTLPSYFGMRPDFAYAGLFRLLAMLFATLSALVGGGYFISRAILAARARRAHIDQPIALGIFGAYGGSVTGWIVNDGRMMYFDFVSAFVLLMLAGRWAQIRATERNRRRLLRAQPLPPRVPLADGGEIRREELCPGISIIVGPGQTLPVDAQSEPDLATFSLASINGEAEPKVFSAGGRVPAGAVNVGRSDVRLRTVEGWSGSLLAQLLESQAGAGLRSKAWERLVGGYVVGILVLSIVAAAGWWFRTHSLLKAGTVGIAVLVVSCPCALGLALPLAEDLATAAARGRGVFVRNPRLWSLLGRVRHIVFDKTGTLTLETPVLQNPQALDHLAPVERSALAGLVQGSLHPVGQCLWEALLAQSTVSPVRGEIDEFPGQGTRLGPWTLGRAGWSDTGPAGPETVLACEGRPIAWFRFADQPRSGAAQEIRNLRENGYLVFILSGDHPDKVWAMGKLLGIPPTRAIGGQTATAKAAWIAAHQPERTLMLGDGANDSLAFDRALCRGTPVIHRGTLATKADFYYLRQGLEGVGDLLEIGRSYRRTRAMVITFSIAYNLLASGFAVAGKINPLVAAVLMPASSLASLLIVGAGSRAMLRACHAVRSP